MKIPSAIDTNTLKAYEAHPKAVSGHNQALESFNLEAWHQQLPESLQQLCVETIAKNWTDNPILDEIILSVDRYLLLDILDTNLPLKLTVPRIPDDVYWRKCYLEKWPKQLPDKVKPVEFTEIFRDTRKLSSACSDGNGRISRRSSQASLGKIKTKTFISKDSDKKTWKQCYLEMYLKDYLENLKPENYDAKKMKELSDLCSPYVKTLRMDQMQCSESSPNRIPLNSVLSAFQPLKELSICFKQTYVGEQFSWNVVTTAFQDIKTMAKGLEKLRLQVLKIRNSDINCDKLITILKPLLKHKIEVLDFYHCKISDKGTCAIAKFILEVPVKELNLANNRIGSKGITYLSYALLQPKCAVTKLDLHLNHLGDDAGNLLLNSINRNNSLKYLCLSGCGFRNNFSVASLLRGNSLLEILDISNNNLGESIGETILEGLKYNSSIRRLDLRMCRIPSETEFQIQELVNDKKRKKIIIETTQDDVELDLDAAQLEMILQ
ncbi:hypothetical protein NQ315_017073 [Exocentrus adspersus]|uniref:T-complex-associated testis-expressed protein 1 n=1 Tax=Exocentrus adspersus TaxID=1586481 RepID=A0AAV8VHR5_9CUCU|nr:hypothetical protein NQ315_017073 [Exocentrus adspersus]